MTVGDLLWWFPRHYIDCREPVMLADARPGSIVVVRVRATDVTTSRSRKGQAVVRATLVDASGEMPAMWFGQPFIVTSLQRTGEKMLVGKVSYDRVSKVPALMSPVLVPGAEMIPIYSVTKGLTSAAIGKLTSAALSSIRPREITDEISSPDRKALDLPARSKALKWIHQPQTPEQVRAARRRFAFDKLLALQLGLWAERRSAEGFVGPSISADIELLKAYRQALPFDLTNGQAAAIWQLAKDMAAGQATRRPLNGDVGSGKTAVAAAGILLAAKSGWQSVLLAPTDLLVHQHVATLRRLLESFSISVGAVTARQKEWGADVLVGTHALWSDKAQYKSVGLVIIDEQHRFGVEQRDRLWNITGSGKTRPHLLSLSATPIPRSLALTLYGGLSVTSLKEKPAGRQPIKTLVARENETWALLQQTVARGEQAYIVCPLIEEVELTGSLVDERRTVADVAEEVKRQVPQARVGILHGKLASSDKDDVIGDFAGGRLDIVVSTTVVEVGVDVPNATLMIIENAERFGIAQLHQLRGRVGRGNKPSTCALVVRAGGRVALERCRQVASTDDGFLLAEYDLRERGPGELVGLTQSGYQLGFIDELDVELIAAANKLAEKLTTAKSAEDCT